MPPGSLVLSDDEKQCTACKPDHTSDKLYSSVDIRNAAENLVLQLFGSFDKSSSEKRDMQMQCTSIYSRLKKFFTAPESALDPSPELNSCLGLLVYHLQGKTVSDFGQYSYSYIQEEACVLIDRNPVLSSRANDIREVASRAESNLERYFADILLKSDELLVSQKKFSYAERIKTAARSFPYINNYVEMVEVESKTLLSFLKTPYEERTIVFCGSGPLPLTGLLLAAIIGCSVILVDNDWNAVKLSSALVRLWEQRDILPSGRVFVRYGNCASLPLKGKGCSRDQNMYHGSVDEEIYCDILFFAALVPNEAKVMLAKRAVSLGEDCPKLAMRSAHGLTARLAYKRTPREEFIRDGLRHLAMLVPCIHNFGNGNIVDDDVKPIAFFPSSILNSLEIYQGEKFDMSPATSVASCKDLQGKGDLCEKDL